MKRLTTLLTWLSLLFLCSPLWFSPDYNSSLDESSLDKYLEKPPTSLQTGYTDGLAGTTKLAWPRRQSGHRVVRYCYVDEVTREKLRPHFCPAMRLWEDALGGEGSAVTGHSFAVHEVQYTKGDQKFPLLCFMKGTWDEKERGGKWNPIVEKDVLAISYKPGGKSFSTVGYTPDTVNPEPYRHILELSETYVGTMELVIEPYIVAHEIGHVLGMLHEHQRNDRDDYVEYKPGFVKGFPDAIKRAVADGASYVKAGQDLKDNIEYARKYDFRGSAYVKGGPEKDKPIDGDGGFDYESIMLYSSIGNSDGRCYDDVEQCPLVKITKDEGGNVIGKERIWNIKKPSQKDVQFVKKYYPWGA